MKKDVIVKIKVKNEDSFDLKPFASAKESDPDDDVYDDFEEDNEVGESDIKTEAFPEEGIEIITEGTIGYNDSRLELKYLETYESDLGNEQTTVSFNVAEPSVVTMERNGVCRTAMVFEAGRRYISVYDVGGMVLELVVRTFELENKLSEGGGSLMLGYTLENGGVTVSRVKMNIEVRLK